MKILYGVQGTGQGHISRARAMAKALAEWNVDVTWLFSGRPREELFDMQPFGNFLHRRGLTFKTLSGKISRFGTLTENNLPGFLRDVRQLDLTRFDLAVTDFEPVTAWAARRAGLRSIGIGHQYALNDHAPRTGQDWISGQLLRHFAPAETALGLHWHPYADNVLPPILDLPQLQLENAGHILVYLPFENQDSITGLLQRFPRQSFIQYSPGLEAVELANVRRNPTNTNRFKCDLASCAGVICNSGFELISECLQWGKPVLTRPLAGQTEQLSNALALERLSYATTCVELSEELLDCWLHNPQNIPQIHFPDVADALARWLATGATASTKRLTERLWATPAARGSSSIRWSSKRPYYAPDQVAA